MYESTVGHCLVCRTRRRHPLCDVHGADTSVFHASRQTPCRPRRLAAHVHPHSTTYPRSVASFVAACVTVSPVDLHSNCIICIHLRIRICWLVLDSRIATASNPPPNPADMPNSPYHRYVAGRSDSPNVAGTPSHRSQARTNSCLPIDKSPMAICSNGSPSWE